MATTREIYPQAPLRFVALEIRYGFAPDLSGPDGRAKVYDQLADDFPLAQTSHSIEIGLPPTAPREELQMLNRERTRSVTVGPDLLAVNTSAFLNFEEFLGTVEKAIGALGSARVASVQRIGIRYIDEIRVPGVDRPDQWHGWIADSLLGPIEFGRDWNVELAETAVRMAIEDEQHLMLRVGPRDQPAVEPSGPLSLRPLDGHFFLLDLDSFWQADLKELREFDADAILTTCGSLDDVAHQVFERSITDRLRDDVLRREADG